MNFRILFCVLFSGIFLNGFSQDDLELSCFKVNKFSIEQRNQNYPYNKTSRIAFVSFKDNYRKLSEDERKGIVDVYNDGNEIIRFSFSPGEIMQKYFDVLKSDFSRYNPNDFEESIDLDESQKNELTDLIFNLGNNSDKAVIWSGDCYIPRNAILFFDEKDELFGFIEICFDCNNYRTSEENIDLDYNCGEKIELLQNLFEKVGIKYGVEKEDY